MWKKTKSILAALLLLSVIATCAPGCTVTSGQKVFDRNAPPFDTGRVATIRIVMQEKDWEFCMTHPFDEQYVPADFWFDDELIPDVAVRTTVSASTLAFRAMAAVRRLWKRSAGPKNRESKVNRT